MKKIILFALSFVIFAGFTQIVFADNAVLSISPASAEKTAGQTFSASLNLNPQGNQVCVVRGTLSFENLTCKSIALASGLMPQTTPTCSSPSFVLGIPRCATSAQNLLSISAKAGQAGTAKINLTGVKIIGAGVDVASSQQAGTYSITAAVQPKTTPAPTVAVSPGATPVSTPEATVEQAVIPNEAGAASAATTMGKLLSSPILIIVIIIILILLGMWAFSKFSKKKPV